MNNLFYAERIISSKSLSTEHKVSFRYFKIEKGEVFRDSDLKFNYFLFVCKGEIIAHCNRFLNNKIGEGEFVLLPKTSQVICKFAESSKILLMNFDTLHSVYDRQMLKSFQGLKNRVPYNFFPLKVKSALQSFIDLLILYLERGLTVDHLFELKEKELFILLRGYYSRDELVSLLHPIIGVSNFKNFVLTNYKEVNNVAELVDLSGMGRTAFDTKFREDFGMSARQWMLKQIAEQISLRAMDPSVSIKDIMQEFKFNSPTHFNWFCHHQFGCTPGKLLQNSAEKSHKMDI